MKLVGDFLSRFQNLTPPNDALKVAVAKAVTAIAGVPVRKNDITLSNGVAFVRCSSIAKSTILVKRSAVLEEIFHTLPKARDSVRDIR